MVLTRCAALAVGVAVIGRWLLLGVDAGLTRMVSKEEALPGRKEKMRISEKHYVLGTPMRGPWPSGLETLIFANGCFWGSEKGVWRLPDGIYSTAVGYAAGFTPNPTYEEVVTGRTGHTEAVQVVFDPKKVGLVDILRWARGELPEGVRQACLRQSS
eukprot:TRINITY_DN15671_c0_g1_i15.p1 TRINITY_DN15671_c0_g1~~TRINITY_DN15671_c0_g1_i15.p1  ORF type:complete len:157 (+),score=16.13 TRINITY_DN15671_c0_g1_i15:77-547(+)